MIDVILDTYYETTVKLPTTVEEREYLSARFVKKTGIGGILGAIDGLLVRIVLPPGTKNARTYHCYKSFYALNVQGVAGPDGELMYVNVGHAGSTGDGYASKHCNWYKSCAENTYWYKDGYFFLADAAYCLMPWCITPYEGVQGRNSPNDIFNFHLAKGRQVVERAFGMVMRRWRILIRPLEVHSVKKMNKIVKVCCMLHNMTLRNKQSAVIRVCGVDAGRTAFNPVEEFKRHCVVDKIRMHNEEYVGPFDDDDTPNDEALALQASTKRSIITTMLHDAGCRRLDGVERGHKRSAAYQISDKC